MKSVRPKRGMTPESWTPRTKNRNEEWEKKFRWDVWVLSYLVQKMLEALQLRRGQQPLL